MGKVINLFENKKEKPQQNQEAAESTPAFEEIVRQNQENAERIRKEREKNNKNVLRSYRIK